MSYNTPKTILLGMDGSEDSDYAFNWYVSNIHEKNYNVVVVHCPEYRHDLHITLFSCNSDKAIEMMSEEENEIKLVLAKINEQLKRAGIQGHIIRRDGHVGEVIVKTAESHGADLIVLGSNGKGSSNRSSLAQTFRKVFVGSTSTFVLHHSTVPVMMIKNQNRTDVFCNTGKCKYIE